MRYQTTKRYEEGTLNAYCQGVSLKRICVLYKILERQPLIHKTRIVAVGPITSWQIDGETIEIMKYFIFLGPQITVDGDCSHEIKRCLLFGRKAMTNLDTILKSRDITLLTKVHIVKAMVFPVVMYGCESWTIKKAERRRMLSNCSVG